MYTQLHIQTNAKSHTYRNRLHPCALTQKTNSAGMYIAEGRERNSEGAEETEMETEESNREGGYLLVLTLQEATCVCRSIIFPLLSLGF